MQYEHCGKGIGVETVEPAAGNSSALAGTGAEVYTSCGVATTEAEGSGAACVIGTTKDCEAIIRMTSQESRNRKLRVIRCCILAFTSCFIWLLLYTYGFTLLSFSFL
jgi:hypothetical protein